MSCKASKYNSLEMEIKVLKRESDLERYRSCWNRWQNNPDGEFDHFRLVCRGRSEVLYPLVIAVEDQDVPRALLVGRVVVS